MKIDIVLWNVPWFTSLRKYLPLSLVNIVSLP